MDNKANSVSAKLPRVLLVVVFTLAVCMLLRLRFEYLRVFSFSALGLDQVENYLLCLGQTSTGRLLPHGNTASFGLWKLGPLVFYIYSLALLIWRSPVAIVALSAAANIAAPVLIFEYFRRRGELFAGFIAMALMLEFHQFARLTGEVWPHMFLPFAAAAWLLLFADGTERGHKWKFLASFFFLSLATNCHMTGFLLIPAGIAMWLRDRGRLGKAWLEEGAVLFLAPYALYIADLCSWGSKEWAKVLHSGAGLIAGGGYAAGGQGGWLVQFAGNYFNNLGVYFGAAAMISLIFCIAHGKRGSMWSTWALIQGSGLAGLLVASGQVHYFLIYSFGAVGTIALMLRELLAARGLLAAVVVALFVFRPVENPPRWESRSLFPVYAQVGHLVRTGGTSPVDISNVHALPDPSTNMGADLEWYTVAASAFRGTGARRAPVKQYLFDFNRDAGNGLSKLLLKVQPGRPPDRYYYEYTSRLAAGSCRLCGAEGCAPVSCSTRGDRALTRDRSVYWFYPEMRKLRTGDGAPIPAKVGTPYEFVGEFSPSPRGFERRLLIVQTNGHVAKKLRFSGIEYSPVGDMVRRAGNNEIVSYVWYVLPSGGGEIRFGWKKRHQEIDCTKKDTLLDVMDVEIPDDEDSIPASKQLDKY